MYNNFSNYNMSYTQLNQGPAVHLQRNAPQPKAETMPLRSVSQSRRLEEDARSVHTDRHYDKSARSGKSPDGSQHSRNPSVHSAKRSENRSQSRDGSVASHNSVSVHYKKMSSSLVSNPDNLICDDCINKNIGDKHKDKLQEKKDADKEHALRTNLNLKKQLELEKEQHLLKLRLYKEGIEGQNQDLKARKAQKKNDEDAEKDKILRQINDKSDLIAIEQKMLNVRDKFRDELADQLDKNRDKFAQQEKDRLELEKRSHNLLIDDGWRAPHREALKNHYKDNLLNQLGDKERDRADAKRNQKEIDGKYVSDVQIYNQKDRENRIQIELEKKDVLKQELEKQLGENADKKRSAEEMKAIEDARYNAKIDYDNKVHQNNAERKRAQVQGFLNDLTGQLHEKEIEKAQNELDAKKPQGTGLHVPQKVKKCYNCADCKKSKALERLNKRYEISRHHPRKNHTAK